MIAMTATSETTATAATTATTAPTSQPTPRRDVGVPAAPLGISLETLIKLKERIVRMVLQTNIDLVSKKKSKLPTKMKI